MKRFFIYVCALLFLLTGCDKHHSEGFTTVELKAVEPVGTVPEAFQAIVNENLFHNVRTFENRVMKYQQNDDGYTITMYDYAGNLLASYSCVIDTNDYNVPSMLPTSDGGFLVVFGFYDHFISENDAWSSQNGVCSIVVKIDSQGSIEWDKQFENYSAYVFGDCFERADGYYFIGEQETPATDTVGTHAPTDLHFLKISKDGTILSTQIIGGSDYDQIWTVEEDEDKFILYCHIQSTDGDFVGIQADHYNRKITVDGAFHLISVEAIQDYPFEKIGIINGKSVYSNNDRLDDFDAGSVSSILDYGDLYLVVSENITGEYEDTPAFISSRWYYTETVYSAYSKDGKLLWRASKDSSPDFKSRVEEINTSATKE